MITNDKGQIQSTEVENCPTLKDLCDTLPREVRTHMRRVGNYAQVLCFDVLKKKPGYEQVLGKEFLSCAGRIFELHDIGRHYIPFEIFNKVEALTEEEQQIIKDHTRNARRAIRSLYEKPFSESVMRQWDNIAVYHHERVDGTGYPEGRVGDEIPLAARICAIADTYDGITSWKPYKERQTSREEAAVIIEKEAGTGFEPWLVEIFKESVKRF